MERRAWTIGAAGAGLAVAAVAVTLAVYALTRPPNVPVPRWPAFRASVDVRKEGKTVSRQQVWWRKEAWCTRLVYADGSHDAWKTSFQDAALAFGPFEDKAALEITQGAATEPIEGFGPGEAKEARRLFRSRKARVVATEELVGRKAFAVRVPRGQGPAGTEKTWWIDTRHGITLRYLERDKTRTLVDWRLTGLRVGAGPPPWKDVRSLEELESKPLGMVNVGNASDPTRRGSRAVPAEQYPEAADFAKRAFGVCREGSSTKVTEPSPAAPAPSAPPPSPGSAPGPG